MFYRLIMNIPHIARFLLIFTGVFGVGSLAFADDIGMATGQTTGTYYAFGRDMADLAKKSDISVTVKTSEGSFDNIKRMNSKENINLAIVQADVLGFFGRAKNPDSKDALANLRVVYPLYNEEIHVLARNDIKEFKDLQGKKVAIGENGSGNMLTSLNLFSMMNITPAETSKISPAQGVVAVLKGELDAAVFVGGKPVRLFKNLEDLTLPENQKYADMLESVHFLPMDSPKMLEEYKPAEITPSDYKFVKEKVPTIAVQSLLVGRDLSKDKNKAKCKQISVFAKAIRAGLSALKETGHAKWKEVDLDANIGSWKKDSCVW